MSLVLAIESSTTLASLALANVDFNSGEFCNLDLNNISNGNGNSNKISINLLAYQHSLKQRSHSEFLNFSIQEIFQKSNTEFQNLSWIACGIGPGSFTGIRVATSIAKSFGYLLKKPVVPVNSLRLLASQAGYPELCMPMINAHKNMVYWSLFHKDQELISVRADFISDFEKIFSDLIEPKIKKINSTIHVLGDGIINFEPFFSPAVLSKFEIIKNISKDNCSESAEDDADKLVLNNLKEFNLEKINSNEVCFSEAKKLFYYPDAMTLVLESIKKFQLNETLEWNLVSPLYIRNSEAEENLARTAKQE